MLLRFEINRELQLGLDAPDGNLLGFETAALATERALRPGLWESLLEEYQERLLDQVCGLRRKPVSRPAPFTCPGCGSDQGFRRRGSRSRPRRLFTRMGRLSLRLAQVGCSCGRRFAPLLQLLGVEPGARLAPGLARRAVALATQTSFAKATDHLKVETGLAPSVRTIRRLVRRSGERCDLTMPRSDLEQVPAILVDGTRIPAGPRLGRKHWNARGVELNIACAVMKRDQSGRRPKAKLEIVGATVGERWRALEPAIRACRDPGIVVSDGDWEIQKMLGRAVPQVPHQLCTFHIHHDVRHRLWRDGVAFQSRGEIADGLLLPILNAHSQNSRLKALQSALDLAVGNGWKHTAGHLGRSGERVSTWRSVKYGNRAWRMDGRSQPEHTTSVLERVMREVNRRIDCAGNRWTVPGARAMVNLLLASRYEHPQWRGLWKDHGNVETWAGLR